MSKPLWPELKGSWKGADEGGRSETVVRQRIWILFGKQTKIRAEELRQGQAELATVLWQDRKCQVTREKLSNFIAP